MDVRRRHYFVLAVLFGFAMGSSRSSYGAECTFSRIERLARQGATAFAIAKQCNQQRVEILDALSKLWTKVPGPTVSSADRRLPSGTPVGQCGCWGYATPEFRQVRAQCISEYAHPRACNLLCPSGGYAWQPVCL